MNVIFWKFRHQERSVPETLPSVFPGYPAGDSDTPSPRGRALLRFFLVIFLLQKLFFLRIRQKTAFRNHSHHRSPFQHIIAGVLFASRVFDDLPSQSDVSAEDLPAPPLPGTTVIKNLRPSGGGVCIAVLMDADHQPGIGLPDQFHPCFRSETFWLEASSSARFRSLSRVRTTSSPSSCSFFFNLWRSEG